MNKYTDQEFADLEVIEALNELGREVSLSAGHDITGLIARGKRARQRRWAFKASTSAVVIAAVAALALGTVHMGSSQQQFFLAPAGLTAQSQPASAQSGDQQALEQALGTDFSIDWGSGQVTVRAGSSSAEGLPTGLTLWTQIFAIQQSPESGELAQFCEPMTEKNVIFSACTSQTLATGQTVYVRLSRTGPGGVKPGRADALACDGVRILFVQPNGDMALVDLSTQEPQSVSTPERRDAARAWLEKLTPRLVTAATDPRVGTPKERLDPEQKPTGRDSARTPQPKPSNQRG